MLRLLRRLFIKIFGLEQKTGSLNIPNYEEYRQQKDMFEPDDDYYKKERESLY